MKSLSYDPYASKDGKKVKEALDLVKNGENPLTALKKCRVNVKKLEDLELNLTVLKTLNHWYMSNIELEMATKAKLAEELYTAEESKDRIAAGKELRSWVQDQSKLAGQMGGTVNILTEKNIQFLKGLPLDTEENEC